MSSTYNSIGEAFEYDLGGVWFSDDEIDDDIVIVKWVLEAANLASIGSSNIMFQHFAGNAYMPQSGGVQTMSFAPGTNTYVWLCNWLDGTAFRGGWTESATEHASPTSYSDFPATQRFEVVEATEQKGVSGAQKGRVTGSTRIVYAVMVDKDNKETRVPIMEKRQSSKDGELGKLQTVYKWTKDFQQLVKDNQ